MAAYQSDSMGKRDRLASLFHTKELSDCVFIIGNEKIRAHKLLLALSSPVFQQMFYGPLANNEVEIGDIDLPTFELMLQFIYLDKVAIGSIATAWTLYYTSQKYCLKDLATKCVQYIGENLTLSTLLLSYEYAELYDLEELMKKCWLEILSYAKYLFKMDYHMKSSTLLSLIRESCINAHEYDLILLGNKWSEDECALKGIDATPENKRHILEEVNLMASLRSVIARFQSLYPSKEECGMHKELAERVEKHFRLVHERNFRFRDKYKIDSKRQIVNNTKLTCTIKGSRKLLLCGIALAPTYSKKEAWCIECTVTVSDFNEKVLLEQTKAYENVYDSENYILVNFKEFISLEANAPYTIAIEYMFPQGQRVLCYHMSDIVENKKKNISVKFLNENFSTVTGISCFPFI